MKSVLKLNKWKHTHSVINWINKIKNKCKDSIMKFEAVDFYPSKSSKTLVKAFTLTKNYCEISENDIKTVTHCCKYILFYNNTDKKIKKKTDDGFDVTQGNFHGAEVCELAELLLLHAIEKTSSSGTSLVYSAMTFIVKT